MHGVPEILYFAEEYVPQQSTFPRSNLQNLNVILTLFIRNSPFASFVSRKVRYDPYALVSAAAKESTVIIQIER